MTMERAETEVALAPPGVTRGSAAAPGPAGDEAARKNILLLIQLRWMAVGGQVVTIAVVGLGLGIALPLGPMAGVLLALVGLNVASLLRLSRAWNVGHRELSAALLFDIAALTLQCYLTGGATNPFVFLYLLQVTLGAVLLDAWASGAMVAVTGLCFAGLTVFYRPLDLASLPAASLFGLHMAGMLVCFALDAALLLVFLTRIARNLRERDAGLAALRQRAAEDDHIVHLGLLASGAAHELGTPLATLSVILGDWRRMPALTADAEIRAEIDAMEGEVRRCKRILSRILVSAGETRGESAAATTLHRFLDDLVEDWREARSATTLAYDNAVSDDRPIVSDTALKQVLFNVLDNAYEASPGWVGFQAARDGEMLVLAVTDRGPGFAPEILSGIGTPYRSSKGRAGGGLGLFLVFNVVRKLGGRVTAANRLGGGAVVTLALPLEALSVRTGRPGDGR